MLRTLTRKVIVGGIGLLVAVALAAAFAINNLVVIRQAVDHLTSTTVEQLELSGQFNTDIFRAVDEASAFALSHDPADREEAVQELHDAKAILGQLDAFTTAKDPFVPEVAGEQATLQQRRMAVFTTLEPKILNVVQAAEANDATQVNNALKDLNATMNAEVEELEERSALLADRSLEASTATVSTVIQRAMYSAASTFGIFVLAVLGVVVFIRRLIVGPITRLAAVAAQVAAGQREQTIVVTSTDEIGGLQQTFNQMLSALRQADAAVADQQRILEARVAERTADLTQALADLRASATVRDELSATIRTLASPVVPVLEGILVMPLIGAIDSERAGVLLNALLQAIEQHRAHMVIMDVTGVPLIDTQVAGVLLQAINAAQLLGAQTVVVGVRPELAQTIVSLGVNLAHVVTRADLQSAVSYAMRSARIGA